MKTILIKISKLPDQRFKMRVIFLALLTICLIGLNSNSNAQQWQGSSLPDNMIFRDGSVGIGTNNPSSKLDVVGKGRFEQLDATLKDTTLSSENFVANKFEVQYEPTSTSNVKGSSLQIKAVTADPAVTDFTNFLQGLRFSLIHRNNGTINQLIGGRFQMGMPSGTWGGSGTSGTINTLKGIDMELYSQKGTINNATGITIERIGTNFSNFTYLRIDQPVDVAGNFGIYNNSAYDNYFEGNLGIGTSNTQGHKLAVAGSVAIDGIIKATELEVKLDVWSDFVFDNDYKLKPLSEVEEFINANKHLPDVPSESEITNGTLKVGEMNAILLQKIEELTLYLIEQDKQIKKLTKELESVKIH